MKLKYRADIDGLRAIAVLSVILFHMDKNILPHGYLGVDVFFVISGFLITSLIKFNLEDKSFNFKDFYKKRIKRILPAMWVVTLVTTVIGSLILLPSDYSFFAKSLRGLIFFISNYFFARESDYFNPQTDEYPLLHMWSLAVEEQFYFIWPILLLIIFKFKKDFAKYILVTLILTSYIHWYILSKNYLLASYGYYSLPTRLGGLCFGALISFMPISDSNKISLRLRSLFAFTMIIALFLIMVKDFSLHTATLSFIATSCTAMIILFPGTIVHTALQSSVAVSIGQLSYSLYLWHWPLLAYLKYLGQLSYIPYLFSIFTLSFLSKRYVEDKFRLKNVSFKKTLTYYWILPTLAFLFFSILIYDSRGLPQRYYFSNKNIIADMKPFYEQYCHEKVIDECRIGHKDQTPQILLIGDSHASHFMPFWDKLAFHYNFSLVARSNGFCLPVFTEFEEDSANCKEQKKWFRSNYDKFTTIFIAARWEAHLLRNSSSPEKNRDHFFTHMKTTLQELKAKNIQIVVVEQIPKFKDHVYEQLVRKKYAFFGLLNQSADTLSASAIGFDNAVEIANQELRLWAQENNIKLFNPVVESIEFKTRIPFRKSGIAYKDANHLNEAGAIELAEEFIVKNLEIPIKR